MVSQPNSHRSVERALRILMSFVPDNNPMGPTEIGAKLDLHPSTASRLAQVLTTHGLLMQDRQTKKYVLGHSAADLGRAIFASLKGHLVVIAQPELDELSHRVGETVALEAATDNGTILAYKTQGNQRLQVSFNLGESLPIHVTAGAKAVLAFSKPELVDRLLDRKFERFTPNTIMDASVLRDQFKDIRRTGISFDRGEGDLDVHAMAAPIFDHAKKPVAAVVLAFPCTRADWCCRPEVVGQLKHTARTISSRLHYSDETGKRADL